MFTSPFFYSCTWPINEVHARKKHGLVSKLLRYFIVNIFKPLNLLIFFEIALRNYKKNMRIDKECTDVQNKMENLQKQVSRLTKISYPIEYFMKFYETYDDMSTLYIITATDSARITQLADLTRLRNTLWLVPKIFWVVVEDRYKMSIKISKFLNESNIPHVHLCEKTPDKVKSLIEDKIKPKAVLQKNLALDWLRKNVEVNVNGVVFFADDDNTYDPRLFEEVFEKNIYFILF